MIRWLKKRVPRLKAASESADNLFGGGSADDQVTKNVLRIQDLFAPDGLLNDFDKMRVGRSHVRVFVLHALPHRVQVGWLDDIYGAGDVDVSIHFEPAGDRDVVQSLVTKETQASSQEHLDRQSGNISRLPELEKQVDDYRALRDAVQLGHDRLFYLTFLVAVYADSGDELEQRCDAVESHLARKGVIYRTLVLRQLEGLQSVLPTASNKIKDFKRNLTTGAGACCQPLTVSAGGHSSGCVLGHNIFTGALVHLDRFAGEAVVSNQHLFLSGVTGAGKSVALRLIALLEAYLGTKTLFIDPEGEYVAICLKSGGQVVRLEPGRFSGLNPLDVEPEQDEDGAWHVNLIAKIEDIHGLVAAVFRYHSDAGLDVRETALLEEAVREEYRVRGINHEPDSLYEHGVKKPMPTISSVQKRLSNVPGAERLADAMKPLLDGGSLGMFDGQTTLMLHDARMICFNLRGLGSDFARFVGVYAALSWVWQHFAQQGGRRVKKSVAIDEAWMFLRHPDATLYLETLARRGRKHGCGLLIATQRFQEFAESQQGKAIIESCASTLVLKQEDHAVDDVVEYFKLASGSRDVLKNAPPGQGVLRVSGTTTAIQISPAPFEWPFVETEVRGRGEGV